MFVLGAGASYAAGLPLAAELPTHLLSYAQGPFEKVQGRTSMDDLVPFAGAMTELLFMFGKEFSGRFWPFDRIFQKFQEQMEITPEKFAPVYRLLHVATAEMLYARSWTGGQSDAYLSFADSVRPGDVILTFNWDTCLEFALSQRRRRFTRQFPRPKSASTIRVLKVHGSADFVTCPKAIARRAFFSPFQRRPRTSVQHFETPSFVEVLSPNRPFYDSGAWYAIDVCRLRDQWFDETVKARKLDGRMPDVSALRQIDKLPWRSLPLLLSPALTQRDFSWYYPMVNDALAEDGGGFDTIAVIGYSFPEYDRDALELLRTVRAASPNARVVVVDPSAKDLPKQTMSDVLGSHELCELGFEDWRLG
jgi:hypothetical protein